MKVSVITAFYYGNAFMEQYIDCMRKNQKQLAVGDSLEIILVNDSPEEEIILPDYKDELDTHQGLEHGNLQELEHGNLQEQEHGGLQEQEHGGLQGQALDILVIKQEKNGGIHSARVAGLKACHGDYVMFLDQDDLLCDDAIARHLQHIRMITSYAACANFSTDDNASANDNSSIDDHSCKETENAIVSVSNALLEQKDGSQLLWYRSMYHLQQVRRYKSYLMIGNQIISPGQCLIPRGQIPSLWQEKICKQNGSDDYFLWLLMLGQGRKFYSFADALYIHKYTGENLSADSKKMDASTYEFVDFLKEDIEASQMYGKEDKQKQVSQKHGREEEQNQEIQISSKDIRLLVRTTNYKDSFRTGNMGVKIAGTLKNLDIFLVNAWFKLKTRTPYGFHR